MFVQSYISLVSIKNNSTKFLTLSKIFADLDFTIVTSYFLVNITLSMEVAINITLLQSSITIACFKVACRIKTNTTWTTKNTTSFHYFSEKIKTNTLQGHKRYVKISNFRNQILAARMPQFHLKILPFASSKSLEN